MVKKTKPEIVVISDAHLGTAGSNAENLHRYLLGIEPKILVINGDFIDGWGFSKNYFKESHFEVIRRILKMMKKGTKVYYITGNHDDFLRRYTGFMLNNFKIVDQLVIQIDGKRTWFFHGDLFDVSIQGKMKYLAKLGGKAYDLLIWSNRIVNKLLVFFGRERMSFSKRVKSSVKLAVKWVNNFEQIAFDVAFDENYDVVCCGHIHNPCIKTIEKEDRELTYLNSGDWIEHNSALEYRNRQWTLIQDFGIDKVEFVPEVEFGSREIQIDKIRSVYEDALFSSSDG